MKAFIENLPNIRVHFAIVTEEIKYFSLTFS